MNAKHFSEKMMEWLGSHPTTQKLELSEDSNEFQFIKSFMNKTSGKIKEGNVSTWTSNDKIKIITYEFNDKSFLVIERSHLIKLLNSVVQSINDYLKEKFGSSAVFHKLYSDPVQVKIKI